MIIQIRGTGGSGKSTLVRTVMDRTRNETFPNNPQENYIEGRKRPISYLCHRAFGPSLFVPGHYETPTGGCDTIQKVDDVYTLVNDAARGGHDVLYEGIMIGDDVTRCVDLSRRYPLMVVALNTPIDECLKGIQARRDERGEEKPLNPKNTISRADRLRKSMMPRLKDAGVECRWASREEALKIVLERLGL